MNIESNILIIKQHSVPIPNGILAHLAFRNEKTQSGMGSMILGNWVPVLVFINIETIVPSRNLR